MRVRKHFPRKLLALVVVLLFVPSGSAIGSQIYADSAGDAPGGAPDVTQVTVSHKLAGEVTFQIAFANRSIVSGEDEIWLELDVDQNDSTGWFGTDYEIGVPGDRGGTVAWIFKYPAESSSTRIPVSWANNTATLSFVKQAVGDPKTAFDFSLMTHTGGDYDLSNIEFVPHGDLGELTYSLATDIAAIQLPKVVTTVKAGKVFTVRNSTVKLTTDEVFTPDTFTAKATVKGKALKPLAGGLSWKVPKAMKGKTLVVTTNATYQGMTKTQVFKFRIVK